MANTSSAAPRHPIGVVANRTGLGVATLRAWERRYGAIEPSRTPSARRLYSDLDIERLRMIAELTATGRRVADIASLPTDELERLVREDRAASATRPRVQERRGAKPRDDAPERVIDAAMGAVLSLDGDLLRVVLGRALVRLDGELYLDRVLAPLLARIGDAWAAGSLSIAHEHLASAVIRQMLDWLLDTCSVGATGPALVVTTLSGERHELGALMAAVAAAMRGWRVAYLGPDSPVDEIARVAKRMHARAVGVSLIAAHKPDRAASHLRRLRDALDDDVAILVGGADAARHHTTLAKLGAESFARLPELRSWLAAAEPISSSDGAHV